MPDAKPAPFTAAERQARMRERYRRMREALRLIVLKGSDPWSVWVAKDALQEPKEGDEK